MLALLGFRGSGFTFTVAIRQFLPMLVRWLPLLVMSLDSLWGYDELKRFV